MNAPGTTPTPKREEPATGITTEISAWIKSERHNSPIDSCELNVFATLHVNGIRVGAAVVSRPFREMPYVTTDAELKETELWKEMAEEARRKAMAEAGVLLDALRGTEAA